MAHAQMTFEQFQAECEKVKANRRECSGWSLSFEQKDYQREWHITAYCSRISEHVQVSSAYATQDTPTEVLNSLILSMSKKLGLKTLAEDIRFGIIINRNGQIHTGGEYLHKASGKIFLLETGELVGSADANGDTPDEAEQIVWQKLVSLTPGKNPDRP